MEAHEILNHLAKHGAVLTGQHFVYTSGKHGPAYIDMRRIGHQSVFLEQLGYELEIALQDVSPEIIVGPETLGRTLATHTGTAMRLDAVWCDIIDEGGSKRAAFSSKMNFDRLLKGKRVGIVDDLLTTGSSIKLTVDACVAAGADVVGAAAVVRRTPDIGAEQCGVPELSVLAEVDGFELFTEAECKMSGPCSRNVPVVPRPGHGYKWLEQNPDYPGGAAS